MKRLIFLLFEVVSGAHAQTISEFRQWYLDKQLTNSALLVNAPANNALLSFSPGQYTVRYPADTHTFNNYQFLAAGTYSRQKSPHHFGAYVWGQQQASNLLGLNYAWEVSVGWRTSLALGANLGLYNPLEFSGAKVFRYGAGVALQSKNKENYIGLSFPHMVTAVHRGDLNLGAYKVMILQGGYTFYLPYDVKFIPAAFLQVDVFRPYGDVKPAQLFATDAAFRYKELIYVNVAASVRNFQFGKVKLQRFGAGIKPTPALMIGYQRDALDDTGFSYHSLWLRYLIQKKSPSKTTE